MAAGRVTYSPHPHELAASIYYAPKLDAVMRDAGAVWTHTYTSPPRPGMPVSPMRHLSAFQPQMRAFVVSASRLLLKQQAFESLRCIDAVH